MVIIKNKMRILCGAWTASSADFIPFKLWHLQKAVGYHRVRQMTRHTLRVSVEAVAVARALSCTCSVGKDVFNLWPCHSNASNLYLKSLKNANPLFFKEHKKCSRDSYITIWIFSFAFDGWIYTFLFYTEEFFDLDSVKMQQWQSSGQLSQALLSGWVKAIEVSRN